MDAWEDALQKDEHAANDIIILKRTLRAAFNYFKEEGWIKKTPKFHFPRAVKVKRLISDSEITQIFTHRYISERKRQAYEFMLHTGFRIGEFEQVKGQDIFKDSDGDWAVQGIVLKRRKDDPDTFKVVKLHPNLLLWLKPPVEPGLLFPKGFRNVLQQTLARVCKDLELPRTRPHDFRHTFCTRYMEKTGDLFGLMLITGQRDIRSVKEYQHLTRGRSQAVLDMDFGQSDPALPPKEVALSS
jgi:integrase